MKSVFLLMIGLLVGQQTVCAQPIGSWGLSAKGLPIYQYMGSLPFTAKDNNGQDANLPENPYFLLGNYRMTLLPHVSGTYQLLTAERAWTRVNAASQTNYGWNDAHIVLRDGQTSKT
ncbi:hypothetical protein [Spirosoma jeollabukense]